MNASPRIPVCVTLPPDLIARADRIAEAEDRSRSYIVTTALRTFCDQIEIPGGEVMPAAADAAADPVAPSRVGGGTPPGTASAAVTQTAGPSGTAALHLDALRRCAAVHADRAATAAEHRARVLHETAVAMEGTTPE